jgi:hypothetical protein
MITKHFYPYLLTITTTCIYQFIILAFCFPQSQFYRGHRFPNESATPGGEFFADLAKSPAT